VGKFYLETEVNAGKNHDCRGGFVRYKSCRAGFTGQQFPN